MSIREIKELPKEIKQKSARELIRADIQEALDKGINLFEFEGDYNYKYLTSYANEVAEDIRRKKVREIQREFKNENLTEEEKTIKGFYLFFKSGWEYKGYWIKAFSQKGEEHRRIFCQIEDIKLLEDKVIEDCWKCLNKARTTHILENGEWIRKPEKRGRE